MSFWDEYWDRESALRGACLDSLKSNTSSDALINWVMHLYGFFKYHSPESLKNHSSIQEAVFYLMLSQLGLVDNENRCLITSEELSVIFRMLPRFREYCTDQVAADGLWGKLKFSISVPVGAGFDLILEALKLVD